MDRVIYKVREDFNCSIKEFLKNNHIGRGKIEEIRMKKLAYVNGKNVSIDSYINKNDVLEFRIEEEVDFAPEFIDLDIVYEDDYLLIVNKPAGIIIHPDNKDEIGTLVNRVASYYICNNINRNIRYLHRIDRDTTGLVMFAKDFLTEGIMINKIENNEVDRYYLALACGKFKDLKGEIVASIGKDRHVNGKMCIGNGDKAKYAKTGYEVLGSNKDNTISLVKFKLYTGRTHQIRVHSSYIKHPLVGDVMYGYRGSEKVDRVCLNCNELRFNHPITNEEIIVKIDMPIEYNAFILINNT